ncbi:MAG: phytoene desaturase family protein [Planctomycetota bacterium]
MEPTTEAGRRVVVIGAGLGGISAALSLAADGYEVRVFEKNDHVGGKLNLLQTEGFSFDLGPSILTLPEYFEKLFRQHGRQMSDYVAIRELTPHWRNFFEDGARIDLLPDPDETAARNDTLGDEDGADLREFLAYSKRLYEKSKPGYFDRGLDTAWQMARFYGPISALRDFDLFSSMHDGVARRVRNEHLQHILDFFIKYVGSSPYDAPGVMNLLAHVQCAFGLWYVDGGMFNLALALDKLAREVGIELCLGQEVVGLSASGGRVTAAELADGRGVDGDLFVCNMEVIPACERLLREPPPVLRKLSKFEPACSGLVLHLGTDREYPQLAHHNFFFSADPRNHFADVFHRKVLPRDPTVYVVASSRTDATQAPDGCENIKALPHIPHRQDEPFAEDEIAALRERVLDKLERMGLEDLRQHIVVDDMWTPADIESRYYSNRGAIYGVVADRKKNRGFKAPKQSPRYANLYFVGGSVNPGGGMPMAVLSGQQVRDRIVAESRAS